MALTVRDPDLRLALREVERICQGACAFVGDVGVQLHVAHRLGSSPVEPLAHAIDVVCFGVVPPERVGSVPVTRVDAGGFATSIAASRIGIEIEGERFPVAAPEHILGLYLLAPSVPADALWSCYVLLRILGSEVDLEQAREFAKRSSDPERQALLAELAYIAA